MNDFKDYPDKILRMKVGDKAPDFTLTTDKGEVWHLSRHLGKVTALLFFPQAETLMCNRQMCSVRDNWTDYVKTKAVIVGISPGEIKKHEVFSRHHRLPLTLLTDSDRKITNLFGKHRFLPVGLTRAIVIIDAKGFVRFQKIMLRAFRPTDRSVLRIIYAARTDALHENFDKLLKESKERNKFYHSEDDSKAEKI